MKLPPSLGDASVIVSESDCPFMMTLLIVRSLLVAMNVKDHEMNVAMP